MDLIERQPVPENLWKTDAGFADLFAHSPAPMWVYDKETLAFLDVNDAAMDLYGYSRDEFLSMTLADIHPPEDVAGMRSLANTPAPPPRHAGEWRHLTRDGRLLNVLVTTHVVEYAGRPAGFVLITNITQTRQAEIRLEISEQQHRSLFQHSLDAIVMVDMDGRYLSLNPAAERLLDRAADDLLGVSFLTVVPPDEQDRTRKLFTQGREAPASFETVVSRPDGARVEVKVSGGPIRVDGRTMGVYAIMRDITEQKRADAEKQALMEHLQREHQHLDSIVSNVPGVVWEIWFQPSPERSNYVSRHVETMLGYPMERWRDDPGFWLTVVHPDDRDRMEAEAWEHLQRDGISTSQFRSVAKDGRVVWIESRSVSVRDESGRLIGMRGVNMDITERKRDQAALQDSEKRFRLLAETATDFISRHTLNGTFLYASPAIRDMAGHDPEDMLGRKVFEFIHPEDVPAVRQATSDVVSGAGVATIAFRFRHGDGSYIWLETAAHVISDPATDGTAEIQCVSRDITKRKRREEALRESEERYRLVESVTHDVIWDWDLVTGELRHNNSLVTVFGYDVSDTRRDGQWWYNRAHPEDRDEVVESIWSVIHGGGLFWTAEYRFAHADGSWVTVLDRGFVMRSESGVPLRMLGSMADITERKRSEDTLRFLAAASETLSASLDYLTTLSNLARIVVPFLADYCAIDVFEETGTTRRLALAHRDPAKQKILRTIQAPYFAGVRQPHPFLQALREGKQHLIPDTIEIEDEATRDQKELRQTYRVLGPHSYMAVPLYARGRPIGAMHFTVAVSSRQYSAQDLALATEVARRASIAIDNARLYREIQRADTAKQEFLAMLSHELRNPLGTISNALQLIHLRGPVDSPLQNTLNVVDRQTRHMAHLVEDLMDVSRITQGKIDLRRAPILLSVLVEEATQSVAPMMETRRHTLEVQLPDDEIWLDVDSVRICQVIGNLLNNAAKYTDPGGHITLSAQHDGNDVAIRVRDNGIGIPKDLLDSVFDLFIQADPSLDRAQGGLGIGLTVVKNLVDIHGGAVWANSDGPGKGSEFTVRLPTMTDPHEETTGRGAQEETAPAPPQALKILLVEDNVDAARTLGEILTLWGHTVRLAHDGNTALDIARQEDTDVVMMDIGLPGMDGYEVARRLKSEGILPDAMLVALTGYGQEEDQRRSQEAGFDHYIVKPVDFSLLQNLLAGLRG